MNTEEELQELSDDLWKTIDQKDEEISELDEKISKLERESYKYECERDELQEKLDDVEERKEQSLELLALLWLFQEKQTPWDKEIEDLLKTTNLLPKFYIPYFIKPL